MNEMKRGLAVALGAGLAFAAQADFEIAIDPDARPMRDVRTSTCGPMIGYAGCLCNDGGEDAWLTPENRDETSRTLRAAGAWFQRMWGANRWFARRVPNPDPSNKKYRQSHPDLWFKFWKDNGFKVLFTLELRDGGIEEFVQWIVDNGYKDVVAGFELGNETYYSPLYPSLASKWTEVVNRLVKIWPGIKLGINVAELFELNPDIAQVRGRMMAAGEIKRDTYFAAADFNRYSAQFIVGMSNCIDKITHVIYHAYGAETPYSCSYYGFQRFRNFTKAFPELKGKKYWLSEIRPRSDEDNRCQRIFREALISAHYGLMCLCQPDFDGYNHHQFSNLSGAIFVSRGDSWDVQWRDAGGEYPDYRSANGKRRMEVGPQGVVYRVLTEAIKAHPYLLSHGTSKAANTEDTFFTSARVTDQVYARRRAIKEGKKDCPKVDGEVEWIAATDLRKRDYCLMMVNTKPVSEKVTVKIAGRRFAAPTYRTVSCPEEFVDRRSVPGETPLWKEMAWEETEKGCEVVRMSTYKGMQPVCDTLEVTIAPHTVQSVTFRTEALPKK